MADEDSSPARSSAPTTAEDAALQDALAAAHAAVWGYGVVGAALAAGDRGPVDDARAAHRDVRDELVALLDSRGTDPVETQAAYALPFPVLSAVDAAALAVTLEGGVASAWAWVLDQATERTTREWAVSVLTATELRAVGWRAAAGSTPVTSAFPGLPQP
jgi:predicted DNA-binding transcriptional regulator YafY